MDEIEEFVDDRQKTWCIHCGSVLADLVVNRDHVPSRSLLLEPYPENLPLIGVCKPCNEGFSLDEEYLIAFLGSVLVGSTEPARQSIPVAARVLARSERLRARIERSKAEYATRDGVTHRIWTPEEPRIGRVILKNARGHAFFEYGEPMLRKPEQVWFAPIEVMVSEERENFERIDVGIWPEVGSRMMTRVLTGQDLSDGWVIVQDGVYRYAVAQSGGIIVRSVIFEYLATQVQWAD
ncbi:MAG: hypothetical protein AB7P44_02570 [Steroidobacteraceae bacterium]